MSAIYYRTISPRAAMYRDNKNTYRVVTPDDFVMQPQEVRCVRTDIKFNHLPSNVAINICESVNMLDKLILARRYEADIVHHVLYVYLINLSGGEQQINAGDSIALLSLSDSHWYFQHIDKMMSQGMQAAMREIVNKHPEGVDDMDLHTCQQAFYEFYHDPVTHGHMVHYWPYFLDLFHLVNEIDDTFRNDGM